MRDEILISLLKQGIKSLEKQMSKIVYDNSMIEKVKMRTSINTKLFDIIDELYENGHITDAESKKTFRRLKKEYKGGGE